MLEFTVYLKVENIRWTLKWNYRSWSKFNQNNEEMTFKRSTQILYIEVDNVESEHNDPNLNLKPRLLGWCFSFMLKLRARFENYNVITKWQQSIKAKIIIKIFWCKCEISELKWMSVHRQDPSWYIWKKGQLVQKIYQSV